MIGVLLDTSVVSDLRKIRPNRGLRDWVASVDERSLFLSVLTIAELRIGITIQCRHQETTRAGNLDRLGANPPF
jgi:predicted nucleic acid-binding protein